MQPPKHETITFNGFILDLTRGSLLRGTEEIKLRPKTFEVLTHLVANSGRLVSKTELIEAVWPNTAVTDDSLVQCLIEVRRALGNVGQHIVKTVPRRGYLFDAQVLRRDSSEQPTVHTEMAGRVEAIEEESRGNDETRKPPLFPTNALPENPTRNSALTIALLGAGAAVILLAITMVAYRSRTTVGGSQPEPIRSIAVLPLKNLSDDPDIEPRKRASSGCRPCLGKGKATTNEPPRQGKLVSRAVGDPRQARKQPAREPGDPATTQAGTPGTHREV